MSRQITPRGPRGPYRVDWIGGSAIERVRKERGLTQAQAAELLEVTERTLRSWERDLERAVCAVLYGQRLDLAIAERKYRALSGLDRPASNRKSLER